MKISKLIFLSLATLVATAAQAQTVLFSWQTDGNAPTADGAMAGTVTGGTITAGGVVDKAFSTESASYAEGVADEYKSTDSKGLKIGKNTAYVVVTPNEALKAGDVLSICGYYSFNVSSSTDLKADLGVVDPENEKKPYQVGSLTLTSDVTGSIYISRKMGKSTGLTAIRIVRPAPADPTDATLSGIKVDGKAIAGFDKEDTSYEVEVPYGTTVAPTVTATASNKNADVEVGEASIENGVVIKVTSQDGSATKEYTVNFKVKSVDLHITSVKLSNGAYATIDAENKTVTFPHVASLAQPTVDFDNCVVADKDNSSLSVSDGKLVIAGVDGTSAEYAINYKEIAVASSLVEATDVAFGGEEDYVYAPGGYKDAGYYVVSKAVEEASNGRISADKIHLYIALPKAEKAIITSGAQSRAIKVFVNGNQISSITASGAANSTIEIPLSTTEVNLVMIESNQTSGDGGFSKIQLTGIQKDTTDPTAIKNVNANKKTTKGSLVIKDNNLVIVRGGKTYNLLGQEL